MGYVITGMIEREMGWKVLSMPSDEYGLEDTINPTLVGSSPQ